MSRFGQVLAVALALAGLAAQFWQERRLVGEDPDVNLAHWLVPADAVQLDPALDGRIVLISGPTAGGEVVDPLTGVTVRALLLRRHVEMFQWTQVSAHQRADGTWEFADGGKSFYELAWARGRVDPSGFSERSGHENPPLTIGDADFPARASLGAYTLSPAQCAKLTDAGEPLELDDAQAARLPAELRARAHRVGSRYCLAADPEHPRPGDLRFGYEVFWPGEATVMGQQRARGLVPYVTPGGNRLELVASGRYTRDEILELHERRPLPDSAWTVALTWGARGLSVVVSSLGVLFFALARGPLPGTGLATAVGATLLGPVLTAAAHSAAWAPVRPEPAGFVLGVASVFGAAALALLRAR